LIARADANLALPARRVRGYLEPAPTPLPPRSSGGFRSAGGWLLAAAMVYAPWAYGCFPPGAQQVLAGLLLAAFAFWCVGCAREGHRPRVPRPLAWPVVVLLALGWGMAINARSVYDATTHTIQPTPRLIAGLPGSADAFSSFEYLLPLTAACLAGVMAGDLSVLPVWRRRFVASICAVGGSIAVFGLLHKLGLVPALALNAAYPSSVFATFKYHGAAGAFLNLCLPLAIAAVFSAGYVRSVRGALLTTALAALVAAPFVNVSKAGAAIAVLLLAAAAVVGWAWRHVGPAPSASRGKLLWSLAGTTVIASVGFSALSMNNDTLWHRFAAFAGTVQGGNGRLVLWGICLPMAADAGPFGEGAGTFKVLMPTSPHFDRRLYGKWIVTAHEPGREVSIWSHADNDYLQAVIEWGWIGAATWGVLFAGAARSLVCGLRRATDRRDRALLLSVGGAVTGLLLHAVVDCPLQLASIQLFVAVYVGLCFASPRWAAAAPIES
jgi:O-antigen ligase